MLLGVDVGGTFTDAVLLTAGPRRRLLTGKVPTTPDDQARGVIAAARSVLEAAASDREGASPVRRFAHGTTVGTNALLERRGAATALLATSGFTDLIEIARQDRRSLYDLAADRPAPLIAAHARIGVEERIGADGVVLPLTGAELERVCAAVAALEVESVAICLLFAYADPTHERRLARALRDALPDVHVSASSEVLPQFREYERCSTTVVDAYLTPLLSRYIGRLRERSRESGLPDPLIMRSSGGVTPAAEAIKGAAWSVLSGPAGGAMGAALLARRSGDSNALGFDMGGTSCDVCVIEDGEVRRTDSREIADRPIQLPMVDVHTVGAGGGSIAWADPGGALRVGPRSAGADPGPACYGNGGLEPTVTDANLLLGLLPADGRIAGGVGLDRQAARTAIERLGRTLGLDPVQTARGIVAVANQEMIRAMRVVTVERGVDPRELALLPFGGAGPLHAAAIADELEIARILCPRSGGVLSALGMAVSGSRLDSAKTVMLSGDSLTAERIRDATERLRAGLAAPEGSRWEISYDVRYLGQSFELNVPGSLEPDVEELRERFESAHEQRYGYRDAAGTIELVNVRVAAVEPAVEVDLSAATQGPLERAVREVDFGTGAVPTSILHGDPPAGSTVEGPAIFELPESTFALPPGWSAEVDSIGTIRASRRARGVAAPARKRTEQAVAAATAPFRASSRRAFPADDPVALQVLNGGLAALCEEMGAVLIRAAHSANIKERRDCSTAIFDAAGELVTQAEHIPVHLGSMPDAVSAVIDAATTAGDNGGSLPWILNDPFRGGTHLPDITLVSELRSDEGRIGWVASRAHHADVGGATPGGMPADSRTLEEEGMVIPPTQADDEALTAFAARMRRPDQRLADLRAQRAANEIGARRIGELLDRHGAKWLRGGMDAVLDYAERRARATIARLPDGTYEAEDRLRAADGAPIPLRVAVTIEGELIRVDFTGSATQVEGNLNCPLSVTRAATVFAVRALTDPDAPPSAGSNRPVRVEAPLGSVLNARPGAAVAAGNVETSSRVADLVMKAMGALIDGPAQGQGTMNNLTLAGRGAEGAPGELTYYETIGGGQGASPTGPGPSAVHVAMSNTLNTPIEALETELPVRVRELAVRRGSGGAGRHRGGDGVIRELEALAPLHYTLIAERRQDPPSGTRGGEDGAPGRDTINGEPIPPKSSGKLEQGDVLRIETPGGGGWGKEEQN